MQPSSDTPAPHDCIGGRYRLDAVIGRGGTSVVYRATDLEQGGLVAVKLLSPAAVGISAVVARLRHEAAASARLPGDHVVRVHAVGELPDGVPYLVMEHLEGSDLAVALRTRGPFALADACTCILQACEALAAAHALGFVHRDLKPANLFLVDRADGAPWIKVLDFGISRAPLREGFGPLTDPGTVLGTPAYMAPEQMEGIELLDGRADVWALATILFELLSGRPRVRGESLPHVFVDVVRTPPPRLSRQRRDVPRAIDAILGRCLAVDRSRRCRSVAELARALAPFAPGGHEAAARVARILGRAGERASPPHPREHAKVAFAAAASLLVGAVIGFIMISLDGAGDARAPRQDETEAGAPESIPVTIAAPAPR